MINENSFRRNSQIFQYFPIPEWKNNIQDRIFNLPENAFIRKMLGIGEKGKEYPSYIIVYEKTF
jgi:hypothetical protein